MNIIILDNAVGTCVCVCVCVQLWQVLMSTIKKYAATLVAMGQVQNGYLYIRYWERLPEKQSKGVQVA